MHVCVFLPRRKTRWFVGYTGECYKVRMYRGDKTVFGAKTLPAPSRTIMLGYWLLVFLLYPSASYLDYAGSAMKIKQGKPYAC